MPQGFQTLRSNLAALPRPVWFLFFGTFLNKFGSFVLPFLTLYVTARGYTLFDAGLAISGYGVGNLSASLIGGWLTDRIGRRPTIIGSMFSGACAMLLLSQATSLPEIIAAAALAGITGEMYRPACGALLADLVPPARRVAAYSAYRLAFNAGWAFGPATAGFLAGHGYFWLFAGDAATSVLFGIVAITALPRDPPPGARLASSLRADWDTLRKDSDLHRLLAAAFVIACMMTQIISTFSLQIEHLGFKPTVYGEIISLNGAIVVLCELPLTLLTTRFKARRVLALGYLGMGAGAVLIGFSASLPALIACIALYTLGEMVSMPVSSAYVATLAPVHMRGRYMGAYGLTWNCAMILAPVCGMQLFALSPVALWLACGVLAATGAFVISRGRGGAVP
jgi:MFS family permease